MKGTTDGGQIVQVEGGHILRSTGRKDRHSKVYTAKGPRDRRVRLSAHTAIQFYDVQDRLGYDRPSKAVDWLIKKAKTAIDKLNELAPAKDSNPSSNELPLEQQSETHYNPPDCTNSSFMAAPGDQPDAHFVNTMKSFFPGTNFPSFSNDDSVSRASFQGEDLGLSLHTFQGNSNSFQESFQRIDGWNNSGEMDSRVGFVMSSLDNPQQAAMFSHRELLQSNLAVNPWNQRALASTDQQNAQPCSSRSSDFESPFELGFRVPARIYGEEEPDNRR